MLPRPERLTKSGLFQRTYAGKQSVSAPLVSLYVLERQPKSAPRLPFVGFVIGKKVHAKATQRNRAKRRVREAYRLLRQELAQPQHAARFQLQQWYSLVWHIKSEALNAPFQDIYRCVEKCLATAAERYRGKGIKAKS